jgi:hypothetical protein
LTVSQWFVFLQGRVLLRFLKFHLLNHFFKGTLPQYLEDFLHFELEEFLEAPAVGVV